MQKLFSTKNESNVLKLWPLFVKLLGKVRLALEDCHYFISLKIRQWKVEIKLAILVSVQLLHKGGAFINSLLYLEELGFRSSSPSIKKIAFIAWKSLIDNFALNPGKLTT